MGRRESYSESRVTVMWDNCNATMPKIITVNYTALVFSYLNSKKVWKKRRIIISLGEGRFEQLATNNSHMTENRWVQRARKKKKEKKKTNQPFYYPPPPHFNQPDCVTTFFVTSAECSETRIQFTDSVCHILPFPIPTNLCDHKSLQGYCEHLQGFRRWI